MRRALLCFVFTLSSGAAAQELAVYRARVTPNLWSDETTSLGVSVAWTLPVRQGSRMQAGARIAYSESRDSVFDVCMACLRVGSLPLERGRIRSTQLVLLFLPYATRSTRVDLGVGVTHNLITGHAENRIAATLATVGLAQRLAGLPVWAAVGYELHSQPDGFEVWGLDGSSASTPGQVLRLGVVLRR